MRYHAKERERVGGGIEWFFEEIKTPLMPTRMILCRVMIGKVEDKQRLVQILSKVPIRQEQANWNCVFWVKEALEEHKADSKAIGTSVLDWGSVRDGVMGYTQKKKDEPRFDGKGNIDMSKVPTFDLIERKETIV